MCGGCREGRRWEGEMADLWVSKTKTTNYPNHATSSPYSSKADRHLAWYHAGRLMWQLRLQLLSCLRALWCVVLSLPATSPSVEIPLLSDGEHRVLRASNINETILESHHPLQCGRFLCPRLRNILFFHSWHWLTKKTNIPVCLLLSCCPCCCCFPLLVNLPFNRFICVTLKSESGKWFSLFTWKLQSIHHHLGADRWNPQQRFVQNYSTDSEDSKRALPPIFMLSLFFNTKKIWQVELKVED